MARSVENVPVFVPMHDLDFDVRTTSSIDGDQETVLHTGASRHSADSFLLPPSHTPKSDIIKETAVSSHIHWLLPTLMLLGLLAGLLIAIGHHFYYNFLDGKVVGDAAKQQWSLRMGSGFAIAVNTCLKLAVGIAYTQYLWKVLRKYSISFETINNAFSLQSNIFSFLNLELFTKIRLGIVLALVYWFLPLTTVFAPATLSVTNTTWISSMTIEVPSIGIANATLFDSFIVPHSSDPSPQLARIVGTVAMSGQRASLQPPSSQPIISYNLQAYVPLLRCSANETVQSPLITTLMNVSNYIDETTAVGPFVNTLPIEPQMLNNETLRWSTTDRDGDLSFGKIDYFSVMPLLGTEQAEFPETIWWNSSQEYVFNFLAGQIWITIPATNQTQMEFINCQCYNSSLTINVNFVNRFSNITVIENQSMNDLWPTYSPEAEVSENDWNLSSSYLSYLYEIGKYLIGTMANGTIGGSEDSTEITKTFFATSSQVYWMDRNSARLADGKLGDGILGSTNQVRNISFAKDIEDFALNSTLSMLSDITLCNIVNTTANVTTTETVYQYKPKNLVLVYSCLWGASAAVVLVGALAFRSNGAGYDTAVSTFAITMQNPQIREALSKYSTAVQPLDQELGKLKLRFAGSEGFVKGDK